MDIHRRYAEYTQIKVEMFRLRLWVNCMIGIQQSRSAHITQLIVIMNDWIEY